MFHTTSTLIQHLWHMPITAQARSPTGGSRWRCHERCWHRAQVPWTLVDEVKVLEAKTKRPVFQLGYVPVSVPVKVFLTLVAPALWSVLSLAHSVS
jgi:hypothetical protein